MWDHTVPHSFLCLINAVVDSMLRELHIHLNIFDYSKQSLLILRPIDAFYSTAISIDAFASQYRLCLIVIFLNVRLHSFSLINSIRFIIKIAVATHTSFLLSSFNARHQIIVFLDSQPLFSTLFWKRTFFHKAYLLQN